jgi:hypothetical protein
MTITERYDEIMALLTQGQEDTLTESLDDAAPEAYILTAAALLGFAVPGVALDLEMPMATLMELYGGRG